MATISSTSLGLEAYTPPSFCSRISSHAPKYRIQMAMTPTPIHEFRLPPAQIQTLQGQGYTFHVKRDDLTGSVLSGNKVRKLEFLLADAVSQNCSVVMSCGGVQSNHARAVAAAACQLGLECHLFLRSKTWTEPQTAGSQGNMYLNKLFNAKVVLVKPGPYLVEILPKMKELAKKLETEEHKKSYIIPVGGSNEVGLFGYLEAWKELVDVDKIYDRFDDIVIAVGSGGTSAGLAIANYLSGSKLKIHAVAVCDDAKYFHQHTNEMLTELGLQTETRSEDILDVVEGYKGLGYSLSTQEELELCIDVAKWSGIALDPTYTNKCVVGMLQELRKDPGRFQGKRILYLHTGGIFGLYSYISQLEPILNQDKTLVTSWQPVE